MDKRIVVYKHNRTGIVKAALIGVLLIALLLAVSYFFDSDDHFELRAIFFVPLALFFVFAAAYTCGEEYAVDASGIVKLIYGKEVFALRWSECLFIGTFYHANNEGNHFLEFACAKTPLRHKSIAKAKRYMRRKNRRARHRRSKPEYSKDDVFPTWKRREAIMLDFGILGEENYALILSLCGGERNARETDYD